MTKREKAREKGRSEGRKNIRTRRKENKAVYTAESVTCDWAGAVMRKLPAKRRKTNALPTDRLTNQPMDRHSGV